MPELFASARPRKRFFLEMFTRDITLEDCILDLIDNSIDGFIRSRNINLGESLLDPSSPAPPNKANVIVTFTSDAFSISDNCGGISREDGQRRVFNFGHASEERTHVQLGAYGIGLKRALFKIGSQFRFVSRTADEGFEVSVNIDEWASADEKLEDWQFPMTFCSGAENPSDAGTEITISGMPVNIQHLLVDPVTKTRLHKQVAQTYSLFLERHAEVRLNGEPVLPLPLPFGSSDEFTPSRDSWEDDGVTVHVLAGLAARTASNEWKAEQAGWYVLCNGRVIVAADKTDLTGWGGGILPQFHSSKSRGFFGVVLFYSQDSLKLPWTTTKRGLNRESEVWLRTRQRMASLSKPVISYLDSLYASRPEPAPDSRGLVVNVSQANVPAAIKEASSVFSVEPPRRVRTTTRVVFDAENSDLDLIKKHLKRPAMRTTDAGRHTFNYFLKQEGLR